MGLLLVLSLKAESLYYMICAFLFGLYCKNIRGIIFFFYIFPISREMAHFCFLIMSYYSSSLFKHIAHVESSILNTVFICYPSLFVVHIMYALAFMSLHVHGYCTQKVNNERYLCLYSI